MWTFAALYPAEYLFVARISTEINIYAAYHPANLEL